MINADSKLKGLGAFVMAISAPLWLAFVFVRFAWEFAGVVIDVCLIEEDEEART